jgi:hypothetical protein
MHMSVRKSINAKEPKIQINKNNNPKALGDGRKWRHFHF